MNKIAVYAITNLAFQAIIGQIGVNSIIKQPMSELFNFDERFLGFLQMIQMIGFIIGSLYVVLTQINPVKGFLIYSLLSGLLSGVLFVPRYLQSNIMQSFIVLTVGFLQFFLLSSMTFSQVIFTYLSSESSHSQQSVWYNLTFIGDIVSLFVTQVFVYNLKLQWQMAKLIWQIYTILIGVIMFLYINPSSLEQQQKQKLKFEKSKQVSALQSQLSYQKQKQNSTIQRLSILCCSFAELLKQKSILWLIISFGFVETFYFDMLIWLPYYYININEEQYSMISIVGVSIAMMIGGILSQVCILYFSKLEKNIKLIQYCLLLISTILYFANWLNKELSPKVQIILLMISIFCFSCPQNRISSTQPIQQSMNDQSKTKTVIYLGYFFRAFVVAIVNLVIGFAMKKETKHFWDICLASILVILAIQTYRKFLLKKS